MSTHSTPILSALADYEHARIFFMKAGDTKIKFEPISSAVKSMFPVFGAHPLTSVFNQSPVFIVEGADEERIWQQAVRSAQGKIKIFPVVAGDVNTLGNFERDANSILESVYDSARGYSLRDGDDNPTDIDDLGRIVRFRLHCYSSENLMLSDEVLSTADTNWETVKEQINDWIDKFPSHQYFLPMKTFKDGGYDRKNQKLKEFRNILASFINPKKSWEVLVGQTIGRLSLAPDQKYDVDGSIFSLFGKKMSEAILPMRSKIEL